jgi:hypothetical protein
MLGFLFGGETLLKGDGSDSMSRPSRRDQKVRFLLSTEMSTRHRHFAAHPCAVEETRRRRLVVWPSPDRSRVEGSEKHTSPLEGEVARSAGEGGGLEKSVKLNEGRSPIL